MYYDFCVKTCSNGYLVVYTCVNREGEEYDAFEVYATKEALQTALIKWIGAGLREVSK